MFTTPSPNPFPTCLLPHPPTPSPQREGKKKVPPLLGRGNKKYITFPPFPGLIGKITMVYQKSHRLGFPFYFNVDADLLRMAREQRKNMTPAEKKLWQRIRGKKLGMKFRRQHPINRFIADFYCHEARLVVEIDGGYHDKEEQQKYDAGRTKELEEFDIRVIRFTNAEVEENLAGVVIRIKNLLPHPPATSPLKEGEKKVPPLLGRDLGRGS